MIYLVEDDESIRKLILYTLQKQLMPAKGFLNAQEFWKEMGIEHPRLILLDLMLPKEDGISVLKKLRSNQATKHLPIIIITAKNEEYDRIRGLDLGADDYVTKPFSLLELIARINAILRRTDSQAEIFPIEYRLGELYVCPAKHLVRVADEEIFLTLKEFELLCLLIENTGICLSREKLLSEIWGFSFAGKTRTVDVHIRTLRKKLGQAAELVETIRGIGYRLKKK